MKTEGPYNPIPPRDWRRNHEDDETRHRGVSSVVGGFFGGLGGVFIDAYLAEGHKVTNGLVPLLVLVGSVATGYAIGRTIGRERS